MALSSNYKINMELIKLEPATIINLYELDVSTCIREPYVDLSYAKYYFHGYHIRPEDSNGYTEEEKNAGILIFNNQRYFYYPIEARDFEIAGDGTMPRPSLIVSNVFPYIKDLTLSLNDLVGATVTRKRVFKKFLDNSPESDPSAELQNDVYTIFRKKTENRSVIEFELVSIIEHNNIFLPRRQTFRNYCSWKYRGEGCGYSKITIIDEKNNNYGSADATVGNIKLNYRGKWKLGEDYKENDVIYHLVNNVRSYFLCKQNHTSGISNKISKEFWIRDVCSKSIAGCAARFGDQPLPFGGFPATTR